MSKVYLIIYSGLTNPEAFKEAIRSSYPSKEILSDVLLIRSDETKDQIYDTIKPVDGVSTVLFIVPAAGFKGTLKKDIWKWLEEKGGAKITYEENS